jgi:hypothetical protein
MLGRKENKKKIMIATQSGTGTGMKNIKTGTLGTITARAPPRAKMAPEAPIPVVNGSASRAKKIFPTSPPRKNTAKKLLSPAARRRKLPRKYRLIILNSMCQRLPWTNMLVMTVHGCFESNAGVRPRRLITASGLSKVNTKIKTFRAIKNHRAFKLAARYVRIVPL